MRCFRKYRYLLSIPFAVSFQAIGEQPVPGMPVQNAMQYMPVQNGMRDSYNTNTRDTAGYQSNQHQPQSYGQAQPYERYNDPASMPEAYQTRPMNNMDMNTGQRMPQQYDSYSGYQGMGNSMPQDIPQVINSPMMAEDRFGYPAAPEAQYNNNNPYQQGSQPFQEMTAQDMGNSYNTNNPTYDEQPHSTFNMQTGERIDNHQSNPDNYYNMEQPVAGSYEPDPGMLTPEEMRVMPPQEMNQYGMGNSQPYSDYSAQDPYYRPQGSDYNMPEQRSSIATYDAERRYEAGNYNTNQPDTNYMGMNQQNTAPNMPQSGMAQPGMAQQHSYPPSAVTSNPGMMSQQNGYSYQPAPMPNQQMRSNDTNNGMPGSHYSNQMPAQPQPYQPPAYNTQAAKPSGYGYNQSQTQTSHNQPSYQPSYQSSHQSKNQPSYQQPRMQHHASQWRPVSQGMNAYQRDNNAEYRNNNRPSQQPETRQPVTRQPLGMTVMAPKMMTPSQRCQQVRRRRHIDINTVPNIASQLPTDSSSCFKPDENLFYSAIMSAQQKMGPNTPWYHQLRMETEDRTAENCNSMYNNAPADPRAIMMCRQQQFSQIMRPYEARYEDESVLYLRQRKQLAEQLFFQCKGALASRRNMIPSGITLPIAYNNTRVNAFPNWYVEQNIEKDVAWAANLHNMRAKDMVQDTLGAFCPGEMVSWITL